MNKKLLMYLLFACNFFIHQNFYGTNAGTTPGNVINLDFFTQVKDRTFTFTRNHPIIATGIVGGSLAGMSLAHPSARQAAHNFIIHSDNNPHELRWDWQNIDTTQVKFPDNFIWGTADSEPQISGYLSDSNWGHWVDKKKVPHPGKACDAWNNRTRNIECIKKLGVSAHRLSIDWSKIEPKKGVINQDALQHYVDFCDALLAEGIQPVVTLHHFVHPQWFEELGAFEKARNIKYFVNFCTLVFNALHDKVTLWCTINEPGIYAMQGYIRGVYPPGKSGISGMRLASKVLKNLLDAHVKVYHTLKKLPGGDKAKIGIVHQGLTFERFHEKWSPVKALIEHLVSSILTSFVRDTVIDYFTTGEYHFRIPGIVNDHDYFNTSYLRNRRKHSLDFIGLNYYSHVFLRVHHRLNDIMHPGYREYDIQTDMPFAVYAEGLYRAIQHISQLKVPIYITENGAPASDDKVRDIWIHRYLYATHKAIQDVYDVRGYFYWTLMDNYEWDMGYTKRFGLYHCDFETQKVTLYPGSQWFVEVIKKHKTQNNPIPKV